MTEWHPGVKLKCVQCAEVMLAEILVWGQVQFCSGECREAWEVKDALGAKDCEMCNGTGKQKGYSVTQVTWRKRADCTFCYGTGSAGLP